jgi:hypothetical protein
MEKFVTDARYSTQTLNLGRSKYVLEHINLIITSTAAAARRRRMDLLSSFASTWGVAR